jgi:hypothetical protein
VPYEVKATPIAARQIAALRGPRRKAFETFVRALAVEGCTALGYRLTGAEPLPQLCVKHLRGSDRVVVAFEDEIAWGLLVGPHAEGDRRANIYASLYELVDLARPRLPRTKPPCCDEDGEPPVLDEKLLDQLVRRVRSTLP